MSMNQLWILSFLFFTCSTTRSENDTGERPGVQDRHFWLAEYMASISHSSTLTGVPPSEVTASTITSAPCLCAICVRSFASDCAPVEVSAWTNPTTLASLFFL